MKRLTLARHAKSSWDDDALADFERPLSARGERDARKIGERMRARGVRPSLIQSSPAVRARRTAIVVAECLNYPREFLQYTPELYLASAEALLETAAAQDDRHRHQLVVAHNPGLEALTRRLVPDLAIGKLPTGAAVCVDIDTDRWAGIGTAAAALVYYDYPKNPEPVIPID